MPTTWTGFVILLVNGSQRCSLKLIYADPYFNAYGARPQVKLDLVVMPCQLWVEKET